MLTDVLGKVNWIDVFMGCALLRCIFKGTQQGFIVEFFKLLGIFFSTFITLHYYVAFGIVLRNYLWLPEFLLDQAGFLVLWLIVIVAFKVIRDGWLIWLKEEQITRVSRLIGGLIAILRGVLVIGLLFVYIHLTGNAFLIKTSQKSFSHRYMGDISPQLYGALFNQFIAPVFPDEKKNDKVFKLRLPKKASGEEML